MQQSLEWCMSHTIRATGERGKTTHNIGREGGRSDLSKISTLSCCGLWSIPYQRGFHQKDSPLLQDDSQVYITMRRKCGRRKATRTSAAGGGGRSE